MANLSLNLFVLTSQFLLALPLRLWDIRAPCRQRNQGQMLTAEKLFVNGRHSELLPPTSLTAPPGDVLLVEAANQSMRTALCLVLTGRMRPGAGSVAWNRTTDLWKLRSFTALADSPGINEPEPHLRVLDLVAEDLALIPRRTRPRVRAGEWLSEQGMANLSDLWIEQLEPADRMDLLIRLALADTAVQLLVVDSPDRHQAEPGTWLPALEAAAQGTAAEGTGRPVAVVAAVASLPAGWNGAACRAGNAAEAPAPDSDPDAGDVDTEAPVDSEAAA